MTPGWACVVIRKTRDVSDVVDISVEGIPMPLCRDGQLRGGDEVVARGVRRGPCMTRRRVTIGCDRFAMCSDLSSTCKPCLARLRVDCWEGLYHELRAKASSSVGICIHGKRRKVIDSSMIRSVGCLRCGVAMACASKVGVSNPVIRTRAPRC